MLSHCGIPSPVKKLPVIKVKTLTILACMSSFAAAIADFAVAFAFLAPARAPWKRLPSSALAISFISASTEVMAFLAATNAVVAAYSAVSASLSSPHLPVPLTAASTDLMWIMKLSLEPRPVQDRIEVLTPVLSLYETRWEFGSESLSAMGMDGI